MFYRKILNKRDQIVIILPALPCLYSPSWSKNIFHEIISFDNNKQILNGSKKKNKNKNIKQTNQNLLDGYRIAAAVGNKCFQYSFNVIFFIITIGICSIKKYT